MRSTGSEELQIIARPFLARTGSVDTALVEDDALTLLVALIGRSLTREQMPRAEWSGLPPSRCDAAFEYLRKRRLVRHYGGGCWASTQQRCASCDGQPERGGGVSFDPETFEWRCESCRDAETEALEEWLRL